MQKQLAILAAAAAALTSVAPASAAVLLPNLFAKSYCEMRAMGADHDGSLKWAVGESIIDGEPVKVTINGEVYDADVIAANRAAMDRCPQYF